MSFVDFDLSHVLAWKTIYSLFDGGLKGQEGYFTSLAKGQSSAKKDISKFIDKLFKIDSQAVTLVKNNRKTRSAGKNAQCDFNWQSHGENVFKNTRCLRI